jgi:hypothetical protein
MHELFYRDLERTSGDKDKSLEWLGCSGVMGETESLIIVAQGRTLKMGYHRAPS